MKPFARIKMSSAALRRGILVSFLALVGSGGADYLWILSRTPGLSETAKAELLVEARRRGYDTGKFIWVRQDSMSGVK